MVAPELEITPECAVYRPVAQVPPEEVVRLIGEAIRSARERGLPRLLVVTTGFAPVLSQPSAAFRYQVASAWAEAAARRVAVAMVVRPELIDPTKFFTTSAGFAGMTYETFLTEDEARAWLAGVRPAVAPTPESPAPPR